MAHDHEHPHDSTYYLDQLCTIAACGALGAVAVLMYCLRGADGKSKLEYILAPQFFTPVLIGGIALLVLVAIRALTLWQEAGKNASHVHDHHQHDHEHHHDHDHHHDHGHDHDHAQAHAHHHDHDHDHAHAHVHAHNHAHAHDDHGHEHGWTPARYAVLMFPIVLYFLGWPNSSFSNDWAKNALMQGALEGPNVELQDKGRIELGFKDLEKAAFDPVARQEYEGKTGVLQGMFSPQQSDKEFTLYRVKINCCAADAVPLQVRIICADNITRFKAQQWVEVEGQIQFRKVASTNKYLPVMMLKSADQVKGIPPKPDYSLD